MHDLELESARLRRLVADLFLEKQVLADVASENISLLHVEKQSRADLVRIQQVDEVLKLTFGGVLGTELSEAGQHKDLRHPENASACIHMDQMRRVFRARLCGMIATTHLRSASRFRL